MKLVNPRIDRQINFEKCNKYLLVVENPEEFYLLTNDLVVQQDLGEGGWVLSDNGTLDIAKNMAVVYDYYNLMLNNKKADTYVKTQILEVAKNGDYLDELSRINMEIIGLNNKLMSQLDLNLMANEDVTFEDLYKISNFSLVEETSLPEKLVAYIDLQIKIKNIKVVALISPFSYFSCKSINAIIKHFEYRGLNILIVDTKNQRLAKDFQKIIIDKDLCVI